jgi:hypothetical protein
MNPIDQKVMEFVELLRKKGEIRYDQEVWDAMEFRKENVSNVRKGLQHFKIGQIQKLCKKYDGNANWILGLEKDAFRTTTNKKAVS